LLWEARVQIQRALDKQDVWLFQVSAHFLMAHVLPANDTWPELMISSIFTFHIFCSLVVAAGNLLDLDVLVDVHRVVLKGINDDVLSKVKVQKSYLNSLFDEQANCLIPFVVDILLFCSFGHHFVNFVESHLLQVC
jgi:hypothetical protein